MGLFKKSDGDDDSNRRALFGSRKKDKSPSTPSNPYAQPIPVDPYTKAKIGAGVAPLPADHPAANGGPASQSPHSIPSDNKYAANRYGNQGGYGSDRFGGSGAGASSANGSGSGSRYGNGGYGGLGSNDPNDPAAADSARNELFGNSNRRSPDNSGASPPPYSEGQGGQGQSNYGGGSNEYSMATFQDRQLTAEEEEEEEVQATKNEMRFVKQGDVASTRNALRAAAQAEETGRATLARLGAQGESIHGTEKTLDMTAIEGRIAEDKAKELKTLNKSMFAVHVANPFTASRRRRERDEKILSTHRGDRDTRDGTRAEAHQTNQRMDRYQFEADSEDEALEDEIEQNLDLLSGATGRLNGLAKATGKELDEQNRHLERIMGKSDYVDDQIAMNRAKLDRIR
ncbi:uncharacterized protein N7500_005883 [Penicillium coprophilum]|uniref:uncharacterized protein n=1 Tax=Penicillium coprophilum TaxID=36646 RepID=UPI00238AC19F|nr:uncharacterized protein N7500_005883 [Penicillium coprophilum]KAJ5164053.1 hypothetical protein N7500_005883 [Penicillium coprophilum]